MPFELAGVREPPIPDHRLLRTVRGSETCRKAGITIAVCSNRLANIEAIVRAVKRLLGVDDDLLIVLDMPASPEVCAVAENLRDRGASVELNGISAGIAHSRNVALHSCTTRYVLFVDDDVLIGADLLEAVRASFADGSHIVGIRLFLAQGIATLPWYISPAQLHFLGVHSPSMATKTWGACMGLDVDFVRAARASFRCDLGHRGNSLGAGDDTTFVDTLKALGGREAFVDGAGAIHQVDPSRLRLRRMVQRALAQGRAERRRGRGRAGLAKEWNRQWSGSANVKERFLSLAYVAAVAAGVAVEALSSAGSGDHQSA